MGCFPSGQCVHCSKSIGSLGLSAEILEADVRISLFEGSCQMSPISQLQPLEQAGCPSQ